MCPGLGGKRKEGKRRSAPMRFNMGKPVAYKRLAWLRNRYEKAGCGF